MLEQFGSCLAHEVRVRIFHFDLQIMNIESLDDFKKRQSEEAVKNLIQEYLDR